MTYPALLFAAGLGTRMGALVADRPKPLINVAGKPLLDHALDVLAAPSIARRVVNVHYKAAMIRAHLAGRDIAISDETGQLLETGGGLRKALPLLGADPVITLNTDAVWSNGDPLTTLLSAWRPTMEALLLLVPLEHALGHRGAGDFGRTADGQITRGGGLVYTGLQMMRTGPVSAVADTVFSLNPVWDAMAARGGLYGVVFEGRWCDVGRPECIELAAAMLNQTDV
jgi:MurNAc alpha-1-phosphate uridylyltransferase